MKRQLPFPIEVHKMFRLEKVNFRIVILERGKVSLAVPFVGEVY